MAIIYILIATYLHSINALFHISKISVLYNSLNITMVWLIDVNGVENIDTIFTKLSNKFLLFLLYICSLIVAV